MKKIIFLTLGLLLFLTGCSTSRMDKQKIVLPEKEIMELNIFKSTIENSKDYQVSYGWIESFSNKNHKLSFDDQEWILDTDITRIEEIGLDLEDDFPNGFYLYNKKIKLEDYKVDVDVATYILSDLQQSKYVNPDEFESYINDHAPQTIFCEVIFSKGNVVAIAEAYLP